MNETRFALGGAFALVRTDLLVLASSIPDLAEPDPTLDAVLDWPFADLAAVQVDGERVHVAARGGFVVDVDAAALDTVVDDRRSADHVRQVVVRCRDDVPDGTTADFSVLAGLVPAARLERRFAADPFDELFDHTAVRSVEAAAVRDTDVEEPAPLGILVFSTGERVMVDRSLVLGRNPAPMPLLDRPRLVRLAGAGVSRRHAVISVDRWQACIDDLGSSNGTEVTLPGRAPQRVSPGHPVGLVAGALVDLGGDVSFVVEDVT